MQQSHYHILCDRHIVLTANGMLAESLQRPDLARTEFDRAASAEVKELFPELEHPGVPIPSAFPIMHAYEATEIFASGVGA